MIASVSSAALERPRSAGRSNSRAHASAASRAARNAQPPATRSRTIPLRPSRYRSERSASAVSTRSASSAVAAVRSASESGCDATTSSASIVRARPSTGLSRTTRRSGRSTRGFLRHRHGNPHRRERRRLRDRDLALRPKLEQREERDRDLDPREPRHLVVEVEPPPPAQQRAPAFEELRDRREAERHVRRRRSGRLDRERPQRGEERVRVVGGEPGLGRRGGKRRRTEAEERLAPLLETLAEPGGNVLRAAVLREPSREFLRRLLGLELGQLGVLVGKEAARLQLEQRGDQDQELAAGLEVELVALRQALDERRHDPGQIDVAKGDLLAQDERQEEVERPLERVEIEVELADCDRHARTLARLPDATLGDRHLRSARRARALLAPLARLAAEELPPDEERRREDEDDDGHPGVQAQRPELVRWIDAQELLEEAAEAVVRDVEREQGGRAEPEPPREQEQQPDAGEVPDHLVQEGRMESRFVEVRERPALGVDLEPPRQVGRLSEELLVPPVPEAADPLREEEAGRGGVQKREHRHPGATQDDRAGDAAEEDASPDAEPALPDGKDAAPLRIGNLAPRRQVVVEPRTDDAGGDAPDGNAEDEVPVAALASPAQPGEADARDDRDQQREAVHVDCQRPEVDGTLAGRRDRRDQRGHRQGILPGRRFACVVSGGCGAPCWAGIRARAARSRDAGRRRRAPPARPPRRRRSRRVRALRRASARRGPARAL